VEAMLKRSTYFTYIGIIWIVVIYSILVSTLSPFALATGYCIMIPQYNVYLKILPMLFMVSTQIIIMTCVAFKVKKIRNSARSSKAETIRRDKFLYIRFTAIIVSQLMAWLPAMTFELDAVFTTPTNLHMWLTIICVPTGQIVDAFLNLAGNSEFWNWIKTFRKKNRTIHPRPANLA